MGDVRASSEGPVAVVDSAYFKFKVMGEFPTSRRHTGLYNHGFTLMVPCVEVFVTSSGMHGVMSFSDNVPEDRLERALGLLEDLIEWCKYKQLIRYDFVGEVREVIEELLGDEGLFGGGVRGAVSTAPIFISYPISPSIIRSAMVYPPIRRSYAGVVLGENEVSRFGVRAVIDWPKPPLRFEGYVRVFGRPDKAKDVYDNLKRVAKGYRVFKDS